MKRVNQYQIYQRPSQQPHYSSSQQSTSSSSSSSTQSNDGLIKKKGCGCGNKK